MRSFSLYVLRRRGHLRRLGIQSGGRAVGVWPGGQLRDVGSQAFWRFVLLGHVWKIGRGRVARVWVSWLRSAAIGDSLGRDLVGGSWRWMDNRSPRAFV